MSQITLDKTEIAFYEDRIGTLIEYYFSLAQQKKIASEKQQYQLLQQMNSVDVEFKDILLKFAS